MRIPLDYYRILGLPIQVSAEQLQQAYRDRMLQLPRREYTDAAIAARKELLEKAYAVLSNPEQRSRYDASYLAHTYEPLAENSYELIQPRHGNKRSQLIGGYSLGQTGVAEASDPTNPPEVVPGNIEPHTPSIEIADEHFVGALLILQELGEYELVLQLGGPYLRDYFNVSLESGQSSESDFVRSDIILTLAFACLEMGREQWQQAQYENAATSLETGQELLLREGLFPSVQGEIQADLYKLRPYRILELLARPEEHVAERRQGFQLLQNMLQERGGIDGTGDDRSGLSIDDFLRFIQQLRGYLTVGEQQSLFEAESQRPSAVASYLAVYALIARGFAQRLPVLIRRAKLLLMRLGKRQDLYLEQAICLLLLGQTEAASIALEHSQEYESLAFIEEHSQGSPDLLPGLCLYAERWLQIEVLPQFRDLAQQQPLLKDYFADHQVQAYLEALPTEAEATNERAPQSVAAQLPAATYNTAAVIGSATVSEAPTTPLSPTPDNVATGPDLERSARAIANHNSTDSPDANALVQVQVVPQRSRRRRRSHVAGSLDVLNTGQTLSHRQNGSLNSAFKNVLKAKGKPLVLLVIGSVLGIAVLGVLVSQTYGRLKQTYSPKPSLQGEQPLVQLDQPPIPIPDRSSQLLAVEEPLTKEMAKEVIQTWLSTKAAAFGSDHAVDRLNQILVEPALSQWQRLAQNYNADDQYRQYKHTLKVNSVKTREATPNQAQVEATVNEEAKFYVNGKPNQRYSYNENVRVRYDLVRLNGQWRIREMKVLS